MSRHTGIKCTIGFVGGDVDPGCFHSRSKFIKYFGGVRYDRCRPPRRLIALRRYLTPRGEGFVEGYAGTGLSLRKLSTWGGTTSLLR